MKIAISKRKNRESVVKYILSKLKCTIQFISHTMEYIVACNNIGVSFLDTNNFATRKKMYIFKTLKTALNISSIKLIFLSSLSIFQQFLIQIIFHCPADRYNLPVCHNNTISFVFCGIAHINNKRFVYHTKIFIF